MCWNFITSTSFIGSSASYGPLDYTLQNIWLWVIDHTIMVIHIIKIFFLCVCSYSVYSCHLSLISSASTRSLPFLSLIVPSFWWNLPLISPILLKIFLIFPLLLFSSISLHCSLKKAFLSLLAILWNSAFFWVYLFLSPLPFTSLQLFVKPPQTTTSSSCISFSLGCFFSVSCAESQTSISILQALCLPDLILWN